MAISTSFCKAVTHLGRALGPALYYEILKSRHSTSEVPAKELQNLVVCSAALSSQRRKDSSQGRQLQEEKGWLINQRLVHHWWAEALVERGCLFLFQHDNLKVHRSLVASQSHSF